MANILHSVPLDLITPYSFYACVEIPAGSKNKYEYDDEIGALKLDRILYTSTHYPHNYGFIPRTWGLDNDPLDVLIVSSEPIVPLALVRCIPIGLLEMKDGGMNDEKIISVCINDPVYSGYSDIHQLPAHLFEEIKHFFSVYKQLEIGKLTEIKGFKGVEDAQETVEKAILRYREKFPEKLK